MRPTSILWFERLLLAALAIDLVNNLVTIGGSFGGQRAGPGSPVAGLALSLLPVALGLLLWFLVARRGSNVARWVTTILVVLGVVGFAVTASRHGAAVSQAMFVVAAFSEMLKLAAVAFLFTASARAWFRRARAV